MKLARAISKMRNWQLLLMIAGLAMMCSFLWKGIVIFARKLDAFFIASEEESRLPHPSGKFSAVVYTRDAGATTSTAYLVGFTSDGELPTMADTVFIADHSSGIGLNWRGNTLEVICPVGREFRKELSARFEGIEIKIEYKKQWSSVTPSEYQRTTPKERIRPAQ